jgi:hypothetical protein
VKRHEVPFVKKVVIKAAGELLSRPAAYRCRHRRRRRRARARRARAPPALRDIHGLNAWGRHREVPHPLLADVDFGIVRASFAVAETGSVLLSDEDLGVDAVAYLAQHLIVLLSPTLSSISITPIAGPSSASGIMLPPILGPPLQRISKASSSMAHRGCAHCPLC